MTGRLNLASNKAWLVLALIVLAAGALRLYRIDGQSFWNDEGNSARLAERSVDLILEGARGDIHPPGYYLALHYWRGLLGQSEAALRGLSALSGVALIIFTFLMGRRLFEDAATGLVAAALVAVNPFEVYYAQEARMYAMLALWAMLATWAMLAWWQAGARNPRGSSRFLVAYVLTAAAGLYTHYAFPFVMLAQSFSVGAWLWSSRGREGTGYRLLSWVGAQAAVVALYLPWLPIAWHQVTSWSPPREATPLPETLADVWRLLNFGQTIATQAAVAGLMSASACVLLSLLPAVNAGERRSDGLPYFLRWGLLACLVLVPSGLILGLGLYRVAYQKFLLVAAAPLSLLVARGLVAGWRIADGGGVWGQRKRTVGYRTVILFLAVLFLFDTARALSNLYYDEAYARADYRAIARYIEQNARPGDAIILNAPNQWEVFTYYHADDAHVFPLARQRPLNAAANEAELERIVTDHRRLFAIFWGDAESDPQRFIESWLEGHTYKAGETWYSDVRLAVYAVPADVADSPTVSLDAYFASGAAVGGANLYLDGYTLINPAPAPGDILQLALFWHTEEPIPERYKVFVHLYNEDGQIVAQTDSEPGGTLRPTNIWVPEETIVDRYGVLIPGETTPGDYALAVGLYAVADPTARLFVHHGDAPVVDRLDLARIRINPDS